MHTNTIENFWSCLKRTLHGTYIAPRAFHLDAYVDEQVFRFNEREGTGRSDRFVTVLKNTDGKRLMYKTLRLLEPLACGLDNAVLFIGRFPSQAERRPP